MAGPSPEEPSTPNYWHLRQLSRALAILDALARRPMRPSELTQHLGLPWATVYRTVSHLTSDGFLQLDEHSGEYGIGPRMWLIGASYVATHSILGIAQPHLEMLAEGTDATVQLSERSERLAVVLFSHHRAHSEIITKATYGYHFPLHCGSKGQVLLAFAGEAFVEEYLSQPLERLTKETITDPEVLAERLARIREQKYSVTMGDVQAFTGSVAAPVLDREGKVRASVCLIHRRSTFKDPDRQAELVEMTLRAAATISNALGWRFGLDQASS